MAIAEFLSLMSRADQVYEKPYCSGNAGGKLAGKSIGREDVNAFAIVGQQQAAFLRRLTRVVAGQQRLELRVPLRHEVETALLHPAVKIFLRDLVRPVEDLFLRRKNLHRLLLHGDTYVRLGGGI